MPIHVIQQYKQEREMLRKFLQSVTPSVMGSEGRKRRRRRKEAHNEVSETLCVGNTADVTFLWGCPDYVVLPLILIQVLKYSFIF